MSLKPGRLYSWDGTCRLTARLGGAIPMMGTCVERGNLCPDAEGEFQSGGTVRSRVPMRDTGTDGFVVVLKPGNSSAANSSDHRCEVEISLHLRRPLFLCAMGAITAI